MSAAEPPGSKTIAVIGAGWAGCAAALALQARGHRLTVFEAAQTPGGRARRLILGEHKLDNGQHILLGAYGATLECMKRIGLDPGQAFLRLPLQMRYPPGSGGMDFLAPRLPAPLHLLGALLRAQGLDWEDRLALARFFSAARWMDWRLDQDCSVQELLQRFAQTARLLRLMWRPLCVAALNTPPETASAQVFLHVLRDSLGARRAASDMLIPRRDLSAIFPSAALAHLARRGADIRCGQPIAALRRATAGWALQLHNPAAAARLLPFEGVVIATQAPQAARLLEGLTDASRLRALAHAPISTCYLQYPAGTRLPLPMFALVEDPEQREWAQFVFDRGQLDPGQDGLLAAVISTSGEAVAAGHAAVAHAVAAQLARAFRLPQLAQPLWSRVITDKRATFSCKPGLLRPENDTGLARLVLAGDYTAGDYPATLEAAVRSGEDAARLLDQALQAPAAARQDPA